MNFSEAIDIVIFRHLLHRDGDLRSRGGRRAAGGHRP